jgi:hypothetical protein
VVVEKNKYDSSIFFFFFLSPSVSLHISLVITLVGPLVITSHISTPKIGDYTGRDKGLNHDDTGFKNSLSG